MWAWLGRRGPCGTASGRQGDSGSVLSDNAHLGSKAAGSETAVIRIHRKELIVKKHGGIL